MRDIASALQAHFLEEELTIAACWAIQRSDGTWVRGTAHGADITISSGDYTGTYKGGTAFMASDVQSGSSTDVQNLEVEGLFMEANVDITVEDIAAKIYDQARSILFICNWKAPDDGQLVVLGGTLGEFYQDSSGRFRSEVRGITQNLTQQITRTASERCDVKRFGDERCKFNVAAVSRTGTIDAVQDRRRFTATLDAGPAPLTDVYYLGGVLTFTSGDNDTYKGEVRAHDVVDGMEEIDILLWDEMPADIAVNDTFTLEPGCDRTYGACRYTHDNLLNMRAVGYFGVGGDRIAAGPSGAQAVGSEFVFDGSGGGFGGVVAPVFNLTDPQWMTEADYDAFIAVVASAAQDLL